MRIDTQVSNELIGGHIVIGSRESEWVKKEGRKGGKGKICFESEQQDVNLMFNVKIKQGLLTKKCEKRQVVILWSVRKIMRKEEREKIMRKKEGKRMRDIMRKRLLEEKLAVKNLLYKKIPLRVSCLYIFLSFYQHKYFHRNHSYCSSLSPLLLLYFDFGKFFKS